jgi:hypothetical protein
MQVSYRQLRSSAQTAFADREDHSCDEATAHVGAATWGMPYQIFASIFNGLRLSAGVAIG